MRTVELVSRIVPCPDVLHSPGSPAYPALVHGRMGPEGAWEGYLYIVAPWADVRASILQMSKGVVMIPRVCSTKQDGAHETVRTSGRGCDPAQRGCTGTVDLAGAHDWATKRWLSHALDHGAVRGCDALSWGPGFLRPCCGLGYPHQLKARTPSSSIWDIQQPVQQFRGV